MFKKIETWFKSASGRFAAWCHDTLSPEFHQFFMDNKEVIMKVVKDIAQEGMSGQLKKDKAIGILTTELGDNLPAVKVRSQWLNLAIELAVQALPYVITAIPK